MKECQAGMEFAASNAERDHQYEKWATFEKPLLILSVLPNDFAAKSTVIAPRPAGIICSVVGRPVSTGAPIGTIV